MKNTTKIYKGTLIYTIGNFSSRFLSFLLFPLYSYYLSTSEYGTYDIIVSAILLLLPLASLQIPESIIKFVNSDEKKKVLSTSMLLCVLCSFFSLLVGPIVISLTNYQFSIVVWFVLQLICKYFLQMVRGLGKNWIYSLSSIVSTVVVISGNIVMLVGLSMGMYSLVYSGIISDIFVILFLFFFGKIYKNISYKYIDKALMFRMLKYSSPLILSGMIWWVMNSSDKFVINYFLGESYNGIYAISYKFPSIITVFYSFYNLSWQDYALKDSRINSEEYYPVIDQFYNLMFYLCIPVMFIAKIFSQFLVADDYYDSYQYIPPLVIGMLFYCLSGFVGIVYRVNSKTFSEFLSALLAAIINIALDLVLIQYIGLWAAALSTMIGFMVVFIVRYFSSKKILKYNFFINKNNIIRIVILSSFCLLYYVDNVFATILLLFASIAIFFIANKNMIYDFAAVFKRKRGAQNGE